MRMIDQSSIRRQNLEKVWNTLLRQKRVSRQALAEGTGLSLMSVSNLVDQLSTQQVLRGAMQQREPEAPGHKPTGRKAELLSIREDKFAWIVLDLTSLHFRLIAVALDLSAILPDAVYPYDPRVPYAENLLRFLREARGHIETSLQDRRPLGIAVVTPGPYHLQCDAVRNSRIPELNDIRIKETLRREVGAYDYFVEEDVKLAIRAYLTDDTLLYYLYIGEGVGGAVAYHGDVLRGRNAIAGDAGQLPCAAGGAYEDALSLSAFVRRLRGSVAADLGEDALLAEAEACARADEDAYLDALRAAADTLAALLHTIIWVLDPLRIVIDCRYALAFEQYFLQETSARVQALLEGSLLTMPAILPATGEVRGVLYGAAQALSGQWFERIV
ncbi:hypothetical protein FACS1894196_2070 [Clostridia bacterium]|nr:hypothetical protein FACS1894196_2070 [Clostridia bacterium]